MAEFVRISMRLTHNAAGKQIQAQNLSFKMKQFGARDYSFYLFIFFFPFFKNPNTKLHFR